MKRRFVYIYAAFILSLVVLVLVAFFFLQLLDDLIQAYRTTESEYKIINNVHALDSYMNKLESASRSYLLTGDSLYLKPLALKNNNIRNAIDSLKSSITNSRQKNKLAFIQSTINLRLNMMDKNLRMAANGDTAGFAKN